MSALRPMTLFIACAATVACSQTSQGEGVPVAPRTQFADIPTDIRDYRYCEIIPIFRNRLTITAEVYNTLGFNECPADLWAGLDAQALKEAYGAVDIRINGPRYWVINEIDGEGDTANGKVVDFGGIEMALRAVLETRLGQSTVGAAFYSENEVQRRTTFTYYKSAMVYELTSPGGAVYRMQSTHKSSIRR